MQMKGMPQLPQLPVKLDKAPVQGRKLLDAMIQVEQDDPTFCLPPAMLADDEVVTQPLEVAAE